MKLYLETTVFNYYVDTDRDGHHDTVQLFDEIRQRKHDAYTSEYVVIELQHAPEPKRTKMLDLINKFGIKAISFDEKVEKLSDIYVTYGVIPERFRYDSTHIAVASVYALDYVISYNFRHINRAKTKLQTSRINNAEGYGTVVICTAKEVLDDEQNDE
jgi:predicted nucleic acid-binding protein